MSNTVYLLAATGESRRTKSLSAGELPERFERHLYALHGWRVPILWLDIDYPLAKWASPGERRFGGPGYVGPLFGWTANASTQTAAETIVLWGGAVWEEAHITRWGDIHQPGWRRTGAGYLPGSLDSDFFRIDPARLTETRP